MTKAINDIPALFEAFKDLKVLVIGDVMIDSYIYGTVQRISPEAPVPVLSVEKREKRLGGAANVALNIQALGATPVLCAIVGADEEGDTFTDLLKQRGIGSRGMLKCEDRVTTVKNRIISGSQQMIRIDSETDRPLSALEQKTLIQLIRQLVDEVDVVIFEDYDKGCLNEEIISQTIDYCNERNIPTAVDPKKRNFDFYKKSTLFKPNLKELKEGLKIDFNVNDKDQLAAAVEKLSERLSFEKALITLSEKGVYLYDKKGSISIPAHIRNIADVSGAGDTVISIAGLCLALGLENKITASIANLGGGIVCEYLGVVPIDKTRLMEEAEENNLFG
ncbi:MAG: D-glycero-beta-D-manno-heptose-7-phosphate kinase [Cyclobacteriaceae bacterium]